jgi:regulator of protease activity HflC (stomatin/prohibitin superfamily)
MTKRIHGLLVAAFCLATVGACTNPSVPEGHEGYVYNVPVMFGQMEYRETLRGPASTGVSWRLYVTNIDMRAKTYAEKFQLLTKDNLRVSFEANTRIQLRPGSSKQIVEKWGGENWYEWNVKEPLRTIVRETVTEFSATDIQLKTPQVGAQIQQALKKKYAEDPFDIISVAIGEIQFPKAVTDAIEQKIAKEEEFKRQEFVLAKTKKEAAIHVLDALGQAEQQRIISETLDPLYLQKLAVDAYRKLAKAPNKTIIVLPNSSHGTGLPLILPQGKKKTFSKADEKLLEEMETKYMKIADEAKAPSPALPTKATGAPLEPTDGDATPPGTPLKPADGDAPAPGSAKPGSGANADSPARDSAAKPGPNADDGAPAGAAGH